MSLTAWAQQPILPGHERPLTTNPDRPEAVKVWVTGNMVVEYVNRARPVTAFTDSVGNPSGIGSPTTEVENTFEGEVGIRVTVEMMGKVTVVVDIGTRRADEGSGTNGGINRFGEGESIHPRLREGHVHLAGLFVPEVSVEAGISTWSFNVRGKGGAFAFDPRHAQTLTRNLGSDGILNVRDDVVNRFAEAAGTNESQPIGGTVTYSNGTVKIDLVLLPTVTDEGGAVSGDDQLYALDLILGLDSLGVGSRMGLIVALSSANDGLFGHAVIYTFGGGTSIMIMKGLEIYGEGYLQAGRAGFVGGNRVSAAGRAAQLGAEWHYVAGNPLPFWFAANFTHITGDDSDPVADPNNGRASRFAAHEGVADLMIIEDPYYGFDWDSNYQVVKVSGGASFNLSTDKHDLDLMAIFAFSKATSPVTTIPGVSSSRQLGNEVDVKATWHVTKQFAIKASFAYLWGSALLRSAMAAIGSSNPLDHAWIAVLGWDLTF
jgi:hypothetical protein